MCYRRLVQLKFTDYIMARSLMRNCTSYRITAKRCSKLQEQLSTLSTETESEGVE